MKMNLLRASVAEFVGTFLLVYFGCGAIVVSELNPGIIGLAGIAVTFGLVVLAIIYAIGHISGAHINPAVTIALACTGKFAWHKVLPFIVAQIVGAIVAALCLRYTLATGEGLGVTVPDVPLAQAFLIEVILTGLLMFIIMGSATDVRAPSHFAGIAIGSTVMVDVFVGGMATGAALNPARYLGPAIVAMHMEHAWLYIASTIVGALLGAFIYVWCAGVKQS